MIVVAPRGFRRTVVLTRLLPGLSSRDPGLTNCPPIRGKSGERWTPLCKAPHSGVYAEVGTMRSSPSGAQRGTPDFGQLGKVGSSLGEGVWNATEETELPS